MLRSKPLAAVAAGLGLIVTGCSGGDGSAGGGTTAGVVELSVSTGFTGGDAPGYEQIVKDFNASHQNIKVTMSAEPWDTIAQKLPSAWMTGQGPDIAAPSSDPNVIAQYVKTQSVLPITLTGDGDSKVNVDKFASNLVDEFTYDGKLYAVPANYATLSLYYNKALFAAAGVKPPTTVAELKSAAKALTKDGTYGLVLADNNTIPMWPVLQWLEGGDIVDGKNCSVLNTAAGRSSLQPWVGLVADDKVSPVGLTGAEADALFSAGKAAMEINGPWAAAGYKKAGIDLGIIKVPLDTNGKSVTLGSTVPLAISAKTKYPEQAQEFLAYWTSKTAQKKFSLTTGFPSLRTDLADDPELRADPVVSVFSAQVPGARLYLPKVPNATQVDSEAYVTMIGSLTRGTALNDATDSASAKIDELTGCSGT
ncbi:ABC transporter substrate-binding protein [Nakamurella sp. DB0629]|uniref:ABC transporter substrate-binding protein n=2 Tax=Nakamurella aerolata TaxID=1656892 RepID=A0A849AGH2_9ACTN|nr:ABC transporter substrate-binding protein [Nakamurella aerolata]NNG37540.1 ABC transporter substrate-binding protein [Nakamurella aerolata]